MEIIGGDDIDAQRVAVGAMEEVTEVILTESPLTAKEGAGGFPGAIVVAEFFCVGRAVNPVVLRPEQVVGRAFGIGEERSLGINFYPVVSGDDGLLVCFAIAVGIAPEGEFGRSADQHPIADEGDGAR